MKITVLTPSIGTPELARAVDSVARQTRHAEVEHIVVADGRKHESNVRRVAMSGWHGISSTPRVYSIPVNTGANQWNGHRIYAHFSQLLVDTDILFLLDEDNAYEPEHIETLAPIAEKHGFAWSSRKVFLPNGEYLGVDKHESVGRHVFMTKIADSVSAPSYALVDTSCWAIRRDNFHHLAAFLEPRTGDRRFTEHMINTFGDIQNTHSGNATLRYYAHENLEHFFRVICK